jgi:predicted site-specific integrase-resolvase
MAAKRAFPKTKSHNVFGQARKPAKMFRAGLYARVSTNDQQTLSMQSRAMREYAARRGWTVAVQVREVGSGATEKLARNCWRPPAVARSMLCWYGGWTAGAGR